MCFVYLIGIKYLITSHVDAYVHLSTMNNNGRKAVIFMVEVKRLIHFISNLLCTCFVFRCSIFYNFILLLRIFEFSATLCNDTAKNSSSF